MRRIIQAALVAVTVLVGLAAGSRPAVAQNCVTDYLRCAASIVTGEADELQDNYCDEEYVRCLGRMIRFY